MKAWTFSHLEAFQTCARQFYEVKVARNYRDTRNEAAVWGDEVHKALEYRVRDGTPLPQGMTQWESMAGKVAALPGVKKMENKLALDENFQPTDWDSAWTRGIIDVDITHGVVGVVFDWKTGRRKITDQLKLYAAYKLAHDPELTKVTTGFVWLKDRKIDKEVVTREEVPAIWQKFLPVVRRLERAHEKGAWPPTPNGLCRQHCPVTGCEFNGRRG